MTSLMTEVFASTAPAPVPVAHTAPRVDLLPPEVHQQRRVRTVQKVLAVGAAVVLCATGSAWVAGEHAVTQERAGLTAAQARGARLQAQQARYADAPRIIAQVEAAQASRASALSTDVAWYSRLDDLGRAAPAGVWLETVNGAITATGAAGAAGATVPATAGDPLAASGIGTVTLTGRALTYQDVAAYLDALAAVRGLATPYLTTSSSDASDPHHVVAFTITAVVTADALTHRFDRRS